jgi:UTP:GlnB (protein PII) uridylyltransferase
VPSGALTRPWLTPGCKNSSRSETASQYRIARTLVEIGLDIRLAKIATLGQEVVDTFYVVEAQNGRPPRAGILAAIEPRVIATLL